MKKLFALFPVLFLAGCYEIVFLRYDVPMVAVEKPADVKERYGDTEAITMKEEDKYFFSDSLLDATFFFMRDAIGFVIKNKSDHTMKLIWDEAVMIEPDNSSTRVMHAGVKYTDRNNSMPPSIIPRRGKFEDQAVPVDRIYWREGYYSQYGSSPGGWENKGIFPWHTQVGTSTAQSDKETFLSKGKQFVGSRIGLLLPFEIEGVKNDYTFWFEVKSVSISEQTQSE